MICWGDRYDSEIGPAEGLQPLVLLQRCRQMLVAGLGEKFNIYHEITVGRRRTVPDKV